MLRRFATVIVCWAIVQGHAGTRDIPLPEGVAAARCVAEDGRSYASSPDRRTLRVDCASAPQTMVRCDFEGAEPLDLTAGALCTADSVPAERARPVLVRVQRPTQLTADWVRFPGSPDANASMVVARRPLALGDRVYLLAAPRDDRFVTFRRPGVSPFTVHASALGADGGWSLPDAAPGGELVARLPRALVAGVKYYLVGATPVATVPAGHVISFCGVRAGLHDVVPEYEGGLRGRPRRVRIEHDQVTFVTLQEEPVGAVQLVTDPALCSGAATLAIAAIDTSVRTGAASVQTVLTAPTRQECVQTIAGLQPGAYRVSLRGQKGQLAAATFQISAQAVTPVSISVESVHVSGRVTLNGNPLPDVVLRFLADGGGAPADLTTRTSDQGLYELTLPAPGRFQVWFQRDGFAMLGNEQETTFSAGTNHSDFDLEGAVLKVTLSKWGRRTPVDISVTPVVMSKPGKVGDNRQVHPNDELPLVFSGLSPGKYAVQARERPGPGQGGGHVAGATVTLDDARLETEIELVFTDTPGILRIVDRTGVPIPGATVKAGQDRLLQTTPGVFSLANIAPGTSVLASAPGFTPVLRLVSNDSPFDIVLTRGRQVRLQFAAGNPPIARGSLLWPETDAPVPLHLFLVTRAPDTTGDFFIHDFPTVPGVRFIAGPFDPPDRYQPVTPDANGMLRVR